MHPVQGGGHCQRPGECGAVHLGSKHRGKLETAGGLCHGAGPSLLREACPRTDALDPLRQQLSRLRGQAVEYGGNQPLPLECEGAGHPDLQILQDGLPQRKISGDGKAGLPEDGADVQLLRNRGRAGTSRGALGQACFSLGELARAYILVRLHPLPEGQLGGCAGAAAGKALCSLRRGTLCRTLCPDPGPPGRPLSRLALPHVQRHIRRLPTCGGRSRTGTPPPRRTLPKRGDRQSLRAAPVQGPCATQRWLLGRGAPVHRQWRGLHASELHCRVRPDSGGAARRRKPRARQGDGTARVGQSDPGWLHRPRQLGQNPQQSGTKPRSERSCGHPVRSARGSATGTRGVRETHRRLLPFRWILPGEPVLFQHASVADGEHSAAAARI